MWERARILADASSHLPSAWSRLGMACKNAGHLEDAAAAFGRALELAPDNMGNKATYFLTAVELGEELVRRGDPEQAAPHLRAAFRIDPNCARALTQEGLGMWKSRPREAAVRLRAAILMIPDLAEAHLNLALALREHGRLQEALAAAQRGAALRPSDMKARLFVQQLRQALQAGQ